jgi:hypothetical protein
VALRYHVWWPGSGDPYYLYNTTENRNRTNYYGVDGVPALKIDGFITGGGYDGYWGQILSRFYMEPNLDITLSGSFNDDTRNGTLDISIEAIEDAYWGDLHVRIALSESELHFSAPNGAVWHHQVMRDMIPDVNGTDLTIAYGQTVDMSQDFSCPSPLVIDNCELIVWVQCDSYGKEIYQAARIALTDLSPNSIDDITGLPADFQLEQNYPNPFNANTSIAYSLNSESRVELDIYDIGGRLVATLVDGVQTAGDHQIVWDGSDSDGKAVASGFYFYRLTAEGKSQAKRMVLLK